MNSGELQHRILAAFRRRFGRGAEFAAYAPGRVEVLGNHTDYNEGFVLSAAINYGVFFASAPNGSDVCRLTAEDTGGQIEFNLTNPEPPAGEHGWAGYVIGVAAGLTGGSVPRGSGFDAVFSGNVPMGAGLSSSAALEMAAGITLSRMWGITVGQLQLARIGQAAEHEFVGVRCGLLDQLSSLYGKADCLVMTDFRTLQVDTIELGNDVCFLICNTGVKHALVDGEYNARREKCAEATRFFRQALGERVRTLRDVSMAELEALRTGMDPVAARRAAHVIGENERVLQGRALLEQGNPAEFGRLMFASHASSRYNFENSCPELDAVVEMAESLPGVHGARLSGGGFGGGVVVMLNPRDARAVGDALRQGYLRKFGSNCDVYRIEPSDGARYLDTESD